MTYILICVTLALVGGLFIGWGLPLRRNVRLRVHNNTPLEMPYLIGPDEDGVTIFTPTGEITVEVYDE